MIARGALMLLAASTAAGQSGSSISPLGLTQTEVMALPSTGAGAGTSGIGGIRTRVLAGDPTRTGPYTIALQIPANTRIAAHTHRDDRVASVVSGTWYFGYGANAGNGVKALGPGSFYTEPAGASHFARTGAKPVILYIHGFGPTDTHYVDQAADPRR